MFGNIILFLKVTVLINILLFLQQQKNYILSLIIRNCCGMLVQKVLKSSQRINLLIATFLCIPCFSQILKIDNSCSIYKGFLFVIYQNDLFFSLDG